MTSSYFEYLGRKDAAPFTNEGLDYEKTEPDLTEAVNKQIDENIKDRDQFFSDNIRMYNETMNGKFQKNLTGLYNLTVRGKTLINQRQTFVENRTMLDGLIEVFKDKQQVAKYAQVARNEEIADNEIKTQTNVDLTLLNSTGEDSSGTKYTPKQILNFKELILQQDFANPKHAAKSMDFYFKRYLPLAKESLMVEGKLYQDMTVDEKDEWYKVAAGNFIAMFVDANPGITEGHLITHFMPTFTNTGASYTGQNLDIANSATDTLMQNQDYQNTFNAINLLAEYKNNPSLGEPLVSSPFSPTGWMNNRTEYHRNIGTLNPRQAAMKDFETMIDVGIKNDEFSEQAIQYILNGDLFVADQHKNSGKKSSLFDINEDAAIRISNSYDTQVKKNNLAREEQKLATLELIAQDGGVIPADAASSFTNPGMIEKVNKLIAFSNLNEFDPQKNPEFSGVQPLFKQQALNRVLDNSAFDPKVYAKTDPYWVTNTSDYIYREAGEFFNKEYNRQMRITSDHPTAIKEATVKTTEALEAGDFDPKDELPMDADKYRKQVELYRIYEANPKEAVNSEVPLDGEQLQNAEDYFSGKTDTLDSSWVSLARLFPKKNSVKLAHDRLVKLNRIKPISSLMGEVDSVLTSPLLNHKSNATKVIQAAEETDITGAPQLDTMINALRHPDSTKHGGVDAIKNSEGKWVTLEKPLSEHTVGEVYELVKEGYTNIGAFDMTPEAFAQVFTDNFTSIRMTDPFDEKKQVKFLFARLRHKANNQHLFGNADNTYRRLLQVKEEDREEFEALFENLPTFLKLENLFGPAAEEFIQQTLPE